MFFFSNLLHNLFPPQQTDNHKILKERKKEVLNKMYYTGITLTDPLK